MTLPVVIVRAHGLGLQSWVGCEDVPTEEMFHVDSHLLRPDAKPPGFYTSTWDPDERTSGWLLYCRAKSTRRPTVEGRRLWVLEPDADASLLVIANVGDYERLAAEYANANDRRPLPDGRRVYDEATFDGGARDAGGSGVGGLAAGVLGV